MEDSEIMDLYWARRESAVTETANKYGRYCYAISHNILHNEEDAQECVNDTYLRAWNAMPPRRPDRLSAFLGRITRNLSINRYKGLHTEKRGFGETPLVLSELNDCVPSLSGTEQAADDGALVEALNVFLEGQPREKRILFIQRYWYLTPIKELAALHGGGESKIKSLLFRMRGELKAHLEKEGIFI